MIEGLNQMSRKFDRIAQIQKEAINREGTRVSLSRFLTFDARCQQSHFSNLRKGLEIADSSRESGLQARPRMNVFLYRSLPGIFLA